MVKSKCPAYGSSCKKCGQENHFANKCPKRGKVHAVAQDSDSDLEYLNAVNAPLSSDQIFAELHIRNKPVKFQVDCGATVNVITRSLAGDAMIMPTKTILQMWNHATVKPLGEAKLEVLNPITKARYRCKFIVVKDNKGFMPLLGNKVSQKMNLITVNASLSSVSMT